MDLQLEGKVALVTAASQGLGRAAALELAREGAKVAICSRTEAIHEAADDIQQQTGTEVLAMQADVTNQEDIDALVAATRDQLGPVDILIINAGGPPPGLFLSFTADDWESAIDLTLMSAVRLLYAVLPEMVERGTGSIVATESMTIKHPLDGLILSNAIRMAVIGMLKTLANEVGPAGVRVNSINPGWTWTSRVQQLMENRAATNNTTVEEEIEKATAGVPLRRMGTTEEYGQTIAWLASPAASYIHGHALIFDGGTVKTPL